MRKLILGIALFFCVQGILPVCFGQSQPSPQQPVTGQPPVPQSQPPAQPQPPAVQYVQVPAPAPTYAANPAIINQYGVSTVPAPYAAPVQLAYAAPPVYGMQAAPVGASAAMTSNGSLTLGGGPIATWIATRAGKTHTWTWNHTVTRPTITPAPAVVPTGPTSFVATAPAPVVQMAYAPPPVQAAPAVYYQPVTTMQPYIAYQPVTTMQPVAPPVQYVQPPVQQQPPPTQAQPPCPPTKRDEDVPPPTRPSSQIPPPKKGLFQH
jgi:hypothetical protein